MIAALVHIFFMLVVVSISSVPGPGIFHAIPDRDWTRHHGRGSAMFFVSRGKENFSQRRSQTTTLDDDLVNYTPS